MSERGTNLPPEQEAIRAKCFHPSGKFVEIPKVEIEQTIPERFDKIVRMHPYRLAVKMGERSLTYDELNQCANRIAHAIVEQHGERPVPIALLFEHGIDVISAILGVLKSGNFYVALDPSFPKERVKYILRDSQAGLIITNDRNVDLAWEVLSVDCSLLNADAVDKYPVSNVKASLSPKSLAVITYTSGSTGTPKGAGHTHENWQSKFFAYSNHKQISPDDRLSLLHSFSFSASHGDFLISLLSGAALLPFDIKSAGVLRLAKWLEEERITISHMPVMAFRDLAKLLPARGPQSSLRLVYLSGAPITEHDFDLYKETFSEDVQLEIGMGSTETGGICLAIIDHKFLFPKEGTPVGYPLPGKTVLLIDENGREVGSNQVGEIAVKSSYLSTGYWNKSELSEVKFLSDPGGGGEHIYLTGDLGKRLPDGF